MSKQRKQDKTPVESTSVRPGSLQEHDQHQSIVSMKQLEEQERELRTIVDSMPQLIAVVDQNERYRFVNAAYAAQWNCSHREIVGHTVLDIVGETIYAEIRPHLELGLGGEQHRYEFKSQLPNSDEEGVKEVTFTPQRNEQGDVVSVHLVSNHIAHSKRNERQSRFRADLFRQINKLTSSTEIMTLATKAVREFFNASRCILFVVDNHDDTVAVLNETKEATLPSLNGNYELSNFWTLEEQNKFKQSHGLKIDDVRSDNRPQELVKNFKDLGIGAVVDGSHFTSEGKQFGLTIARNEPCKWRNDDVDLVSNLAGDVFNALRKAESQTELHKRECELAKSQHTLSLALEAANMGVFSWAIDDDLMVGDTGFRNLMNLGEANELPSATYFKAIHPDDVESSKQAVQKALDEYSDYEIHYRVPLINDGVRWLANRGQVTQLPDDQLRISGVCWDITKLKTHESQIASSERKLRLALDAANLGLWTWDTKHNRIIWSNQIHESADIESEAEIGTVEEFLSMVHREDRIAVESSMNRCIQDGEPFRQEFRFKRTDGSYRWVLSMAHGIDQKESGFSKMAGVEIDITERKEWEIRLAKMEKQASDHSKRLAMALKSGDMAAWEWTPDGSVWTEDVFRMLGIPKQMASSDLFFSFVHAEDVDELKEVWARATGGEDTYYHEFRIIRPTGEVRWMVGVGEVVRNQNGQVKNVYGLNWDSTEEHVTAERLRASERAAVSASESKSEFLANMSHEIRTPMSAIIGYSDILARHLKDPDDLNCVSIIRDNGNFLLEIIGDILDISKIEAGKFEIVPMTFRVGRLVADVRSLMHVRAVEKLLELSVELDGQIPKQIKSDSKRLKQILVNLIGNAIKFTESGSVKIVVRYLASGPRPKIRFDISDTGIGMTEAQQKKVFQPFTQADASVDRKFGGTGLGLAISQRLAHMLGGEITIKSELGIGSTFSLTISIGDLQNVPMIDNQTWDPTAPALQKRLTETPCLDGLFLVVDDRREIRFIAQHFIEDAGGTVATGENGQEAIDAIEKAESAGMPFDLLVIDMQMPILDGYEATRRLRAAGFEKPIIALTAHAMEGDREECLKAGCTDYISKPLDGPRFTQLLQGYLSKKSINTPSDSSTKKILIIDDAHQAADAVSILLSLNGHDVRTANDGESGIELAKSFGPEVVLIDLGLPDMTGFEVLKQLRENSSFASTKFIAATGRDNHDETSKAGFHHHIVKPIDVDKLEKWLQSSDRRET